MKKLIIIVCMLSLLIACNQNDDTFEPIEIDDHNEVEEEVIDELGVTLHYMGRASVRIDVSDGRVLYIDPYAGASDMYEPLGDILLVSHQHTDHNAVFKVELKDDGMKLSCPFSIKSGQVVEHGDIKIEAVSAYNANHAASQSCGFVITIGDIVIYHSGDTSTTEQMSQMKDMHIDYALLCMDGFYNMGPEEAMSVAELIGAQAVIPIHTSGDNSYSSEKAKEYVLENRLIVKPGESIELHNLSETDGIAVEFEDVIEDIIKRKNDSIKANDMKAYMKDVSSTGNGLYYNEQERWFDEMTSDEISDVSLKLTSFEKIDKRTAIAYIAQSHQSKDLFEFDYPLVFKYEDGKWKDHGYYFNEYQTERFVVKYMDGEERLEEFVQMLNDAFDNLDSLYPLKPIDNYEMKLFSNQELLRQRTIPSNPWLFTGWSEPDESLKLYTGQNYTYDMYAGVVQHELVHHISLRLCKNNLPLWLVEGIAMYDGSAHYGLENSRLLSSMTRTSVSNTIQALEDKDLYSRESFAEISSFYATSYMYVKYIEETYGRDQLMKLFQLAGRKGWHFSAHDEQFEENNVQVADEVLKKILGVSKDELSEAYLLWLETQAF